MKRHNLLLPLLSVTLLILLLPTVTRPETRLALGSSQSKKIFQINKRCSIDFQVILKKIVFTDNETIVNLQYTRNPKGWVYVFPNEPENVTVYPPGHKNALFIIDAISGQKFSLLKIKKGPVYPDFKKMEREQTLEIELILERINKSIKRFHLIEGVKGDWNFINVRLEPPNPDFEDESIRNRIKNELEVMFDQKTVLNAIGIEIIDELNVLKDYTPIEISALWLELEHFYLPSGPPFGIFAYHGENLLYLNHANDNLAKVLSAENIVNSKTVSPRNVAELIIWGKINKGQVHSRVINDYRNVLACVKPKIIKGREEPSGYELDKGKIEKYKDIISAPHWEDKGTTRNLVFYCLTGWMHKIDTLNKFTAVFDKSSSYFTLQKETLEQGIFKKHPNIIY